MQAAGGSIPNLISTALFIGRSGAGGIGGLHGNGQSSAPNGAAGSSETYVTFGSGCGGSLPPTSFVPSAVPRLNATLLIRLNNVPVNAAFLLTGWSNTTSSFGALPLDLGGFGMPGCSGRVSVDSTSFLLGSGGHADYSLFIPNSPGLVGARFYHQALVLDPTAGNAFGAVMSDAAVAVVGT